MPPLPAANLHSAAPSQPHIVPYLLPKVPNILATRKITAYRTRPAQDRPMAYRLEVLGNIAHLQMLPALLVISTFSTIHLKASAYATHSPPSHLPAFSRPIIGNTCKLSLLNIPASRLDSPLSSWTTAILSSDTTSLVLPQLETSEPQPCQLSIYANRQCRVRFAFHSEPIPERYAYPVAFIRSLISSVLHSTPDSCSSSV